jgi:hypothetical protein
MSELIKYPDNLLPLPLLAAHSVHKKSGLLTTKMDSGYARRRRRFNNVPIPVPIQLSMSSDEYAVFEGWFDREVNGGVERFIMPVKTATGIQYQIAEFDSDGYKAVPKSATRWIITAKLLFKKIDLLDPLTTGLLIEYGYSVDSIHSVLSSLEKMVNHNNLDL